MLILGLQCLIPQSLWGIGRTIYVLAAGLAVFILCSGMLVVVHLVSSVIIPKHLVTIRIILTDLLSFVKVLLGQVMHRLKLTWLANEGGSAAQTESTFRILFWIGIVSWIVSNSLPYAPSSFIEEKDQATDAFYMGHFIVNIALLVVAAFRISLICKTREHIRNKYKIPSQQCHGCEDLCCAFWCSCCTVAQMARHTGDYATYQGMCCSETGLPPHAPSIV
eukprot:CCRYP_006065-RB/>CCRYP_006065-RB protein AED:0.21 eAED:0.21 QI:391/1/1/1/1/1/3/204/220